MKKGLFLLVLLILPVVNAQVPIIEFNFTKSAGGILREVPRTILIPENELFEARGNKESQT